MSDDVRQKRVSDAHASVLATHGATFAKIAAFEKRFGHDGKVATTLTSGERTFKVEIVKEEKLRRDLPPIYVASCAEPDVTSDGPSPLEALAALREALELYLEKP